MPSQLCYRSCNSSKDGSSSNILHGIAASALLWEGWLLRVEMPKPQHRVRGKSIEDSVACAAGTSYSSCFLPCPRGTWQDMLGLGLCPGKLSRQPFSCRKTIQKWNLPGHLATLKGRRLGKFKAAGLDVHVPLPDTAQQVQESPPLLHVARHPRAGEGHPSHARGQGGTAATYPSSHFPAVAASAFWRRFSKP